MIGIEYDAITTAVKFIPAESMIFATSDIDPILAVIIVWRILACGTDHAIGN